MLVRMLTMRDKMPMIHSTGKGACVMVATIGALSPEPVRSSMKRKMQKKRENAAF